LDFDCFCIHFPCFNLNCRPNAEATRSLAASPQFPLFNSNILPVLETSPLLQSPTQSSMPAPNTPFVSDEIDRRQDDGSPPSTRPGTQHSKHAVAIQSPSVSTQPESTNQIAAPVVLPSASPTPMSPSFMPAFPPRSPVRSPPASTYYSPRILNTEAAPPFVDLTWSAPSFYSKSRPTTQQAQQQRTMTAPRAVPIGEPTEVYFSLVKPVIFFFFFFSLQKL
jgi:hypothetical protein